MSGEAAAINAQILLPELVKSVLKALVDGASMTCWGSRFQSVATLWLKNVRRMWLCLCQEIRFRLCPLSKVMSSFCELEKLIMINVLFFGDYFVCFN